MAVDVLTEITIAVPAEVVAAYAADPANAPAWYENITSVTWETEPPLRAGSRMAFTARFLGRKLAYTYEVTQFTPGERLVMRTAQGPFPMETTYTWQAMDDHSTRMTLRNSGEPAGFPKAAARLMTMAIRRANRKDLRNLRAILETGLRGGRPGNTAFPAGHLAGRINVWVSQGDHPGKPKHLRRRFES
jgi:uncharacterized membrane protein